mmetsp:Transcript_11085/g.35145  ORF Transcript_11085/g.35145 Transcript_11085/m.35145 type:complete len:231 (-) Transcript_11085:175-867(-)
MPVQGLHRVRAPRMPPPLDPRAPEPLRRPGRVLLLQAVAMRALQGDLPHVHPPGERALAAGGGAVDAAPLHRAREHGARLPAARGPRPARHLPGGEGPQARPRPRERRPHCRRVHLSVPRHDLFSARPLPLAGQQVKVRHTGGHEEAAPPRARRPHFDPDGPHGALPLGTGGPRPRRRCGTAATAAAGQQQRPGRARAAAVLAHAGQRPGRGRRRRERRRRLARPGLTRC